MAKEHEHFERYLMIHYNLKLDDIVPADVPGYWELREPCGGAGKCKHPVHTILFNEGPCRHTISYFDPPRDTKGRFASPYRTWRKMREELKEGDKCRNL